jgi:hypothetical protein
MPERRQPNLAQYSRETVLDPEQCAEWLGVSIDTLDRADVPCAFLGVRLKLYVVGEVLDFLNNRQRRSA